MSLPTMLSVEALSFWKSPIARIREPFRAHVVADVHLRATMEGEPIPILDPSGMELELVHPCLELEPCPGVLPVAVPVPVATLATPPG